MRPVRFVALSEDGQALVLADEVGRLLALPIDERIAARCAPSRGAPPLAVAPTATADPMPSLSPRDIQARIRSGESAEDVARIAGVPVDRVLRYAGPVLQERAMLAQHARRTRLKSAEKGAPLAEVVDAPAGPARHRHREDLLGRVPARRRHLADRRHLAVAARPPRRRSGSSTRPGSWSRRTTTWRNTCAPSGPRRSSARSRRRSGAATRCPARRAASRAGAGTACRRRRRAPRVPAATRSGPGATRCSPRSTGRWARPPGRGLEPRTPAALAGPDAPRQRPVGGGAAALLGGGRAAVRRRLATRRKEVPAVPSLAVLRPRRTARRRQPAGESTDAAASRASACRAGTTCSSARPGGPRVVR